MTAAEDDVGADGECLGMDRAGEPLGVAVGVHPHGAEVGAEAWLHKGAHRFRERDAATGEAADRILDIGGDLTGLAALLRPALQRLFLFWDGLPGDRSALHGLLFLWGRLAGDRAALARLLVFRDRLAREDTPLDRLPLFRNGPPCDDATDRNWLGLRPFLLFLQSRLPLQWHWVDIKLGPDRLLFFKWLALDLLIAGRAAALDCRPGGIPHAGGRPGHPHHGIGDAIGLLLEDVVRSAYGELGLEQVVQGRVPQSALQHGQRRGHR
jgi:hypothetical protein